MIPDSTQREPLTQSIPVARRLNPTRSADLQAPRAALWAQLLHRHPAGEKRGRILGTGSKPGHQGDDVSLGRAKGLWPGAAAAWSARVQVPTAPGKPGCPHSREAAGESVRSGLRGTAQELTAHSSSEGTWAGNLVTKGLTIEMNDRVIDRNWTEVDDRHTDRPTGRQTDDRSERE